MAKKKVKLLYRANTRDSMIGGVCAGIANYFELDPTLVRLAYIIVTMFSWGMGIVAYMIMWIITPRKY